MCGVVQGGAVLCGLQVTGSKLQSTHGGLRVTGSSARCGVV